VHPLGGGVDVVVQLVVHSKTPAAPQVQLIPQNAVPPAFAVAQPVPGEQAAPGAQLPWIVTPVVEVEKLELPPERPLLDVFVAEALDPLSTPGPEPATEPEQPVSSHGPDTRRTQGAKRKVSFMPGGLAETGPKGPRPPNARSSGGPACQPASRQILLSGDSPTYVHSRNARHPMPAGQATPRSEGLALGRPVT
jgi:hypothetical protein